MVGGVGESIATIQAGSYFVVGKNVAHFNGMGHWFDVVGADLAKLINVSDDLGQFAAEGLKFAIAQPKASEQRDFFDIFASESHRTMEN